MKKRPPFARSEVAAAPRLPAQRPGLSGAWVSIAHAAKRADVCTRTIKRWIAAEYLTASRNPSPKGKGHLRIRLGDLEALLARGAIQ